MALEATGGSPAGRLSEKAPERRLQEPRGQQRNSFLYSNPACDSKAVLCRSDRGHLARILRRARTHARL